MAVEMTLVCEAAAQRHRSSSVSNSSRTTRSNSGASTPGSGAATPVACSRTGTQLCIAFSDRARVHHRPAFVPVSSLFRTSLTTPLARRASCSAINPPTASRSRFDKSLSAHVTFEQGPHDPEHRNRRRVGEHPRECASYRTNAPRIATRERPYGAAYLSDNCYRQSAVR